MTTKGREELNIPTHLRSKFLHLKNFVTEDGSAYVHPETIADHLVLFNTALIMLWNNLYRARENVITPRLEIYYQQMVKSGPYQEFGLIFLLLEKFIGRKIIPLGGNAKTLLENLPEDVIRSWLQKTILLSYGYDYNFGGLKKNELIEHFIENCIQPALAQIDLTERHNTQFVLLKITSLDCKLLWSVLNMCAVEITKDDETSSLLFSIIPSLPLYMPACEVCLSHCLSNMGAFLSILRLSGRPWMKICGIHNVVNATLGKDVISEKDSEELEKIFIKMIT